LKACVLAGLKHNTTQNDGNSGRTQSKAKHGFLFPPEGCFRFYRQTLAKT
jgi:hypothetical protein